jgi:hypothetical protein
MALFGQLQTTEQLPLFQLNFGVVTLRPKKEMQFKYNNIDQYLFFMLASIFSQ